MNAGRESRTHVGQPAVESPIRSLSRPLAGAAADPASSRPRGPMAATDEEVRLRLALWLADVAAEAAPAAMAGVPRSPGRLDDPPMAESGP